MILPSKHFARDASKLAAQLRAAAPSQYAGGGIVRGPHFVVDSLDVEPAKPYDGPIRSLMSPYERPVDQRKAERIRAESCAQTVPFLGRTPAEAAENLRVKLGHCPHGLAEEVRLCTGEVVAAVCPTCLEALPASFVGSDWRP